MGEDTSSTVKRVKYGRAETVTTILTADNMSARPTPDGGFIVELFRHDSRGMRCLESWQFHFSPEDRATIRRKL
jgi:hypothetical protein